MRWGNTLIALGFLPNNTAFGYPGALAFRLTNEAFAAVNDNEMYVFEQSMAHQRIAEQALEPFNVSCGGKSFINCLRTIRDLEEKKTPKIDALSDIKARLVGMEKTLYETDLDRLGIFYKNRLKPSFDAMPYGSASDRESAAKRLLETVKRSVEARFKSHGMPSTAPDFPLGLADNEDIARALGHIVDGLFDLNVNPVEAAEDRVHLVYPRPVHPQ
jgi:hypothetical protein